MQQLSNAVLTTQTKSNFSRATWSNDVKINGNRAACELIQCKQIKYEANDFLMFQVVSQCDTCLCFPTWPIPCFRSIQHNSLFPWWHCLPLPMAYPSTMSCIQNKILFQQHGHEKLHNFCAVSTPGSHTNNTNHTAAVQHCCLPCSHLQVHCIVHCKPASCTGHNLLHYNNHNIQPHFLCLVLRATVALLICLNFHSS